MKKLLSSIMVACLLVLGAVAPVSAAGSLNDAEKEIMTALKAGVVVDGVTVNLRSADIAAAEKYLSSDGVDISTAEKTTVMNNISAAKSYMQTNKIKDIASIKGAHASAILGYAQAAAQAVGLTISVSADKTYAVRDSAGNVVYSTTKVIKKTGYDLTQSVVMGSGLVAVLLAVAFYANKKELLAK